VLTCPVLAAKPIPAEDVNPRLSSSLQLIARQATGILPKGADAPDPNQAIAVIIEPLSGNAASIKDSAIRLAGGTVEARSQSLIRVRLPIHRLENLADDVAGIAFIREPYPVRPVAVTSQGVVLTGADDFHTAGYTGQGVKVAVIDLGFDGLAAAQAAGELRNVIHTWNYITNSADVEGTGEVHGTGVAEIVEDMAPGAELYLLLIGDSVDLENAVQYCIINGIHIINHSVAWFNTNFYDGTGSIAGFANNARDQGILWVNAAGNYGDDGHWQGYFNDNGGGWNVFSGSDTGNRVYIPSSDSISIYLTWDDWSASDQDYDLYLYNSSGVAVASSLSWQSGFQAPVESLYYVPADDGTHAYTDGYYDIKIHKYSASGPMEMEFFAFLGSGFDTDLDHHMAESSISAPANSSKVVAVGAISRWNWTIGPQASYSSLGPSNTGLIKPDIAGPASVSNWSYGSFAGTSASSPHVAGAAALLLSEDPSRTANDLQTLLEAQAIDMGLLGKDNVYGSGRLNLVLTPSTYSDPRAYWRFNEGSGAVASDSSGNGNAGTIYGASWVSGSPDSTTALSFDGVNDFVEVPTDVSLSPRTVVTVEAWVRLAEITTRNPNIVSKDHEYFLGYETSTGRLRHGIHTSGWNVRVSSSAVLPIGTWVHVAMVYDGSQMRFYMDGTLTDTFALSGEINQEVSDVVIGAFETVETQAKSQFLSGAIDEVRITGQALLPSEFNGVEASSKLAYVPHVEPQRPGVLAVPNPASMAPMIFRLDGAGYQEMRVEVFDLTGTRIFASPWGDTPTLEWDLRNVRGQDVANGAYLAVIEARSADRFPIRTVLKVFVLRR
jgi:subtilisin family serine protease